MLEQKPAIGLLEILYPEFQLPSCQDGFKNFGKHEAHMPITAGYPANLTQVPPTEARIGIHHSCHSLRLVHSFILRDSSLLSCLFFECRDTDLDELDLYVFAEKRVIPKPQNDLIDTTWNSRLHVCQTCSTFSDYHLSHFMS